MKSKLYFVMLLILIILIIIIGFTYNLNVKYWAWIVGGLVLYIWCKDVLTGTKWFEKPKKIIKQIPDIIQEEKVEMTYDEYIASLPDLKKIEKEGYVELTDLCVATENQQKLFDFFKTVKDFSADDDYMTTLNYVIEYLDKNKIHFIMSLDWKASINDLKWRINSSLKDNYGLTIDLPKQEDYEERATVSFDNVFEDFDKPLRNKGIQMGFIDTQSDEYVIFLHKIADKQKVEKSVEKIGYKYHEK